MENITIVNSELSNNIIGIGVKKIKLDGKKLEGIKSKALVEEVKEEVINPVINNDFEKEQSFTLKHEDFDFKPESNSSFLYNGNNKKDEYEIDDDVINAKVSKNYGGYREEVKSEKKTKEEYEVKQDKISEKDFEKLLSSEIVNSEIREQIAMYKNLYTQKQLMIKNLKSKQAKIVDSFQKVSNEDQSAKADNDLKKNRINEMKKAENFKYLEVGANEDSRIIEAIRQVDDTLKNLLNTNLKIYNETKAKIEQYANDKIELEKNSSKVREEIKKQTEDLNGFMIKSAPLIIEIIEADQVFKKSKEAGQKIEREYEKEYHTNEMPSINNGLKRETFKEPDIPKINENNFNSGNTNLFDVLRRSTPDVESTQELKIPDNRKTVTNISSEIDQDFSFGSRRAA
ncbi:MAG: hypothetical protein ACI4PE_04860 [Bacilli bacterium]